MRPPMSSDSEDDDYDGFSFGNEFERKAKKHYQQQEWLSKQQKENEYQNKIVLNIKNGDLEGMKKELQNHYGNESRIEYNDYLKDGWTLLLHAISNLQFDIVMFLINKGADINRESASLTPLMLICKQEPLPGQVDNIVNMTKLLLYHGAIVNIRNETGLTPFMYACTVGNTNIVELILNLSAIDAVDNSGNTPLHYAVENRHLDIIRILINAGADTEIFNAAGLKPRDLAVSLALTEIEELFPEENVDYLPATVDQYRTYRDLNPLIFPDYTIAAYSQNIPKMLRGMRAENCTKQIYEANISLAEFLTIDDSHLQTIGIEYDFQRKRILHGLLKFHGHHFSPRSIEFISNIKHKNLYQFYEMYAGYLKHLIVMESSIIYMRKIGAVTNVHDDMLIEVLDSVDKIRKDVLLLQQRVQEISATSTKNPLFIGPTRNQCQRYNIIFGPFFKYTVMIGLGLLLSFNIIKLASN